LCRAGITAAATAAGDLDPHSARSCTTTTAATGTSSAAADSAHNNNVVLRQRPSIRG
jgi:hypothetical protein